MLREMAGLGFTHVELSHGIRITLVPGVLRAVEEGIVKVASCHNFCPLPTGVMHAAPNLYQPSSRDAKEREQWLRHSKRSLDFASQVGATKLVLHLGAVGFMFFNPEAKVERYVESHAGANLRQDPAFQRLLASALRKIQRRQADYWTNTRHGIEALLPYAAAKGIVLGIENRESLAELPLDAEHAAYLAGLPTGAAAGYWHDTGHAHIKASMGVFEHREHLVQNAPRAVGFHLHDVRDGHDHQAIGSGQIDFSMVSEFWRPEHTLVIELSPRVTEDGVLVSRRTIEMLIDRRFGA